MSGEGTDPFVPADISSCVPVEQPPAKRARVGAEIPPFRAAQADAPMSGMCTSLMGAQGEPIGTVDSLQQVATMSGLGQLGSHAMQDPQPTRGNSGGALPPPLHGRTDANPRVAALSSPAYAEGFKHGFLAAIQWTQQNLTGGGAREADMKATKAEHVPVALMSDMLSPPADMTGHKASRKTQQSRRPYRFPHHHDLPHWFCSKCWIKNKQWRLRSIKLPCGRSVTINGHTSDQCPEWPKGLIEPTSEQNRAYGTAFKQLQRSGHLRGMALVAFKDALPTKKTEEITAYLDA